MDDFTKTGLAMVSESTLHIPCLFVEVSLAQDMEVMLQRQLFMKLCRNFFLQFDVLHILELFPVDQP